MRHSFLCSCVVLLFVFWHDTSVLLYVHRTEIVDLTLKYGSERRTCTKLTSEKCSLGWTGLLAATILESFIQAQKMSVRRALRRGFRKYLADPSDFFALLLVELQKMVR